MLQAAVVLIALVPMLVRSWEISPFSRKFTPAHVLPHAVGFLLLFACWYLSAGEAFKAAWMFVSIPDRAFSGFGRGVHAALWVRVVLALHMLALVLFAWAWGLLPGALFTAYSLAVSSLYLSLALRLINAVPFTTQPDPARSATLLPLMIAAVVASAIAVGVQFFLFSSPGAVAAAAAALGIAAFFFTRTSLRKLEISMRHALGRLSAETGAMYTEINT